jgi:hypothetical protein
VPVVRLFIAAYHVAGYFDRRQRLLLGLVCWFVGTASEPLPPRSRIERRCPAYWALWLPRRAAWRCSAHRLPLFRPASYMVLSALPCRCIFC